MTAITGESAPPGRPATAPTALTVHEAASALRVLRYGGVDESTTGFELPPAVRATVSPTIAALRWSATMYGLVQGAPKAADGDLAIVVSLTIAMFFASWRSFRPLHLAGRRTIDRVLPITDAVVLGAAAGVSGALRSPFVFCVLVAVLVASFGWGWRRGLAAYAAGGAALAASAVATNASTTWLTARPVALGVVALAGVGSAAVLRERLLASEERRLLVTGRMESLSETNELLQILNRVARTLPAALDLRDALDVIRDQLRQSFAPTRICLLTPGDADDTWAPQIADGWRFPAEVDSASLPEHLRDAARRDMATHAAGGLYAALHARGDVVGLLGIEHDDPSHFTARDARLLDGLTDVLALTLDNARWYGRLRSLGAENERGRIARDLHDRLGQWLTYISFELERLIDQDGGQNAALQSLYDDVQRALDELRETLRQLRTAVTAERPLAVVARETVERFAERTGVRATFVTDVPAHNLAVPIEHELLRVLQEALHNIDKHAKADEVNVAWHIANGSGTLVIADDGRGFDAERGIRNSAFGLVGMRERADVIGAHIDIASTPGAGTTITITTAHGAEQ